MENKIIFEEIMKIRDPNRTVIIGIDGLGGAGKSTVSSELKQAFEEKGVGITILHIDDFIHPRAVRYNDKFAEWECYYFLQWRYDYLVNDIIGKIKDGGNFKGTIEIYDKENDTYTLLDTEIPKGSVVLTEGIFLQRKELENVFDYIIYIDVPEEERLKRVLERDGYIGDKEQIRAKYESRYFPAERYYQKLCSPAQRARLVVSL